MRVVLKKLCGENELLVRALFIGAGSSLSHSLNSCFTRLRERGRVNLSEPEQIR
jgi:hypothetical protein